MIGENFSKIRKEERAVAFDKNYATGQKNETVQNDDDMKPADDTFPKTRFDPYRIFRASKTPAGLYARKKWLNESETPAWQEDFHQTVSSLMQGQSGDGSWFQSPLESVRRLFGLHLTIRDRTKEIEKALRWLMKQTLTGDLPGEDLKTLPADALRDQPFIEARTSLTLVCATLFLSCVFQRDQEKNIENQYVLLCRWVEKHADDENVRADLSNALRALIVHPDFAQSKAAEVLIDLLGRIQDPSGQWPAPIPFFQTVNALAHSPLPSAYQQCGNAMEVLLETQNGDGSWGKEDQEWNTFLVVHALRNRGYL